MRRFPCGAAGLFAGVAEIAYENRGAFNIKMGTGTAQRLSAVRSPAAMLVSLPSTKFRSAYLEKNVFQVPVLPNFKYLEVATSKGTCGQPSG